MVTDWLKIDDENVSLVLEECCVKLSVWVCDEVYEDARVVEELSSDCEEVEELSTECEEDDWLVE